MCGIAGIIHWSGANGNEVAIQAMTLQIAHRGPDAHNIYVDPHAALGHRRLSIIDLSESANQPMTDSSGRYVIIYNGEIYNYKEIKSQIANYPFRTDSDTEVILAGYIKWGPAVLDKLNGMFALAIWDKEEEKLFIARDRVGKKPLYYFNSSSNFVFGSEVRSLLASGLVPRVLNTTFLPEYLMYQAPMDAHTLVQDVVQLKAGHYAFVKEGTIDSTSYWNYDSIETTGDDYEKIRSTIKDLFIDAVRYRMVSDVPVGAFLSGGIDSSLVVACMAELSAEPVNTFNISFAEQEFDESQFAEQIAKKYNTKHHRILIRPSAFLDSLEDIFAATDSPSGDGANTYLVAKHTREKVKVALSGLGGDELFAGYSKFSMFKKITGNAWVHHLPFFLRKWLAGYIENSGNRGRIKLADLMLQKKWDLATIYPALRKSYRHVEANSLVTSKVNEDFVETNLRRIEKGLNRMGDISKCTIGELETYTRDVLLRDTDQMAMAHALEVRAPFFDYRLIEYMLSLPDQHKLTSRPKQLLVDSLSPRIPESISERKKMGFTFPIQKWLRHELRDLAHQKISFLADRDEFNHKAVIELWENFQSGSPKVNWSQVWQLVVLGDWIGRNKL